MQILFQPISFIKKINSNNSLNFRGLPSLREDTFEKTTSNIFSAENLREIFLNSENKIGHGANNVVYSIPDNDEYVLRVNKRHFYPETITKAEYTDLDKCEDFNIGQMVGRIKVNGGPMGTSQFIEVLRKQEGKSYGVPHHSAFKADFAFENEIPYEDYSRKMSFKTLLDKASKMDITAYEKMLETFNKAQEAGYSFDPFNSNNLLLTDSDINMIDFSCSGPKCSYLELLNMITNHEYLSLFYMDPKIDEFLKHEAYEQTLTIISKFLKAMQNKGLKLNFDYLQNRDSTSLIRCYEFWNAIGYDEKSGIPISQYLEQIGLFDSTLQNSKLFF